MGLQRVGRLSSQKERQQSQAHGTKAFARRTKDKKTKKKEEKLPDPVMLPPFFRKKWDNRLQLKWKKPDFTKMTVKQYLLQMKCDDDIEPDWSLIGEFPQETTVYVIPDLLPGRKYHFRLKCIFINDSETPWSEEKSGCTDGEYDASHVQQAVKTNAEYREI